MKGNKQTQLIERLQVILVRIFCLLLNKLLNNLFDNFIKFYASEIETLTTVRRYEYGSATRRGAAPALRDLPIATDNRAHCANSPFPRTSLPNNWHTGCVLFYIGI